MAKRKRRQSKNKLQMKQTIQFELVALLLIALAIISMANLGAVGHAVVLFFRFFIGEWFMIGLVGMIIYGGYLMWRRQRPFLFPIKLIGIYIIMASLLLLSHVTLFQLLSNGDKFSNPSVIVNTWELYWMEVKGESSTTDLGGGMIGAVLFALFYYLFDEAGTKLLAFVFIIIGFILLTGKTFGGALGKVCSSIWGFMKKQWFGFIEDVKSLKQEQRKKREERRDQKQEEKERRRLESQETGPPVIHVAGQEVEEPVRPDPIISSFSDRVYQQNGEPTPTVAVEEIEEEEAPPITFTEVTEVENVD